MMQFGKKLAACMRVGRFVSLCNSQCALDDAQLPVTVEHVVDRASLRRRGFLGDVRDHPSRRHRKLALVLRQLTAQQREQARFAAAVGADQSKLVAGMHGKRSIVEQQLHAAGEREIRNSKHV